MAFSKNTDLAYKQDTAVKLAINTLAAAGKYTELARLASVCACVCGGGWVGGGGGGQGQPSDAGLQMMRPSDRKYNSVGRSMIVPSTT